MKILPPNFVQKFLECKRDSLSPDQVFSCENSPVRPVVTAPLLNGSFICDGLAGGQSRDMEGTAPENAVVFVIENSADYMYELEQTLRKAALPIDLKIARYGNEAVLYLKGVGIYGDRTTYPLPRVIVLDLDLPDGSPLAVLGWIRQQTELAGVSVITTGYPGQQKLIQQARELGAIAWFPKSEFPSLISTIESLVGAGAHHHFHHAAA